MKQRLQLLIALMVFCVLGVTTNAGARSQTTNDLREVRDCH